MPDHDPMATQVMRHHTDGALPPGSVLNNAFEITEQLGRGGFGVTYLAIDRTHELEVAIKEYFPAAVAQRVDGTAVAPVAGGEDRYDWGRRRFLEETKQLARLKHDNIVRIYQTFLANGTAYGVFELVKGEPLGMWLRQLGRRPSQAEMDAVFSQLLDALDYIHRASMLHRDIALDTILIRSGAGAAGGKAVPVILDFGAAKDFFRRQASPGAVIKPGFSPPEQYLADASRLGAWSDIYALAAVMYTALTGSRPLEAVSRQLADRYQPLKAAVPSSAYRVSFLDAIDWGLQLRPQDRPQKTAEWGPALFPGWGDAPGMLRRRNPNASKIFISYRRDDSKHVAGRIYDRLTQEFGDGEVVFDVDTIPAGVDFQSHIAHSIDASAVVIAVVGNRWLNRQWRPRRSWIPFRRPRRTDFVEVEIELALSRRVPVIPVLIDDARMPPESDLPAGLRPFSFLHAASVRSGRDFRVDMERVIQIIRELRAPPS